MFYRSVRWFCMRWLVIMLECLCRWEWHGLAAAMLHSWWTTLVARLLRSPPPSQQLKCAVSFYEILCWTMLWRSLESYTTHPTHRSCIDSTFIWLISFVFQTLVRCDPALQRCVHAVYCVQYVKRIVLVLWFCWTCCTGVMIFAAQVTNPAMDFGWHDPGFIHTAVMTGLTPSTSYSYYFGG